MLTNIEVCAKLAFAVAHNQDAFASNIAHHAVTNVGEFVGTAYVAPAFTENGFEFCGENFGRGVFISRKALLEPSNFWC
jgi:hypothetical protein